MVEIERVLAGPVVQLIIFVTLLVVVMDGTRWVLGKLWKTLGGGEE